MDGMNRTRIIDSKTEQPAALALDPSPTNGFYWSRSLLGLCGSSGLSRKKQTYYHPRQTSKYSLVGKCS